MNKRFKQFILVYLLSHFSMIVYSQERRDILKSELQIKFETMLESYRKIDTYFDTASECLNYCEEKIRDLKEEREILEKRCDKFMDIINGYDDYRDCFKEYIISIYEDYSIFKYFEGTVYIISIFIIIRIPLLMPRIIFSILLVIMTLYNIYLFVVVSRMKRDIKNDVLDKYGVDVETIEFDEIRNMDMCVLKNKVREVEIEKEIDNYEFYIRWKNRGLPEASE